MFFPVQKPKLKLYFLLHQRLENDFADFAVRIQEQQIDEAFTPEERFAKMRRQNAHFDALSQQLGLELK